MLNVIQRYTLSYCTIVLVLGMSCLAACTQPEKKALTKEVKHVVIIGVDALSPNGIVNANTPVIDSLIKEGAYTLNARGVLPTSSSSNWASMVSGAGVEQHGVTSNDWERDDYILPPVTTGLESIFPTLFGELRQQVPEAEIGAIYAWKGFGRLIERSALDMDQGGDDDANTALQAARYIKEKKPTLLFVHLDHVDHVGHSKGHKTSAYYQAVEQADHQIGQILDAVISAGIQDDTIILVTADHGGIGYGHGGETIDEIEIPFIVYGAGVKKGYLIKRPVYTYDTASTVAFLLGITANQAWVGKPIISALEGFDGPEESHLTRSKKVKITAPVLHPKARLYEPAGGIFTRENAQLKITAAQSGAEIRYTLDGSEPTRSSLLYSEPVSLTQSSVVMAKSFMGDNQESGTIKGFYHVVSDNPNNGIHYQYYEGDGWRFLPVFSALTAVNSGKTQQFRINDINQREAYWGIRYSAALQIDTAGEHKFYTASDDGSKLYINDEEVVNNDGGHGTIERAGKITLKPGRHKITVDYFNARGGYWLDVYHKPPGSTKQLIAPDKLFLQSLPKALNK